MDPLILVAQKLLGALKQPRSGMVGRDINR